MKRQMAELPGKQLRNSRCCPGHDVYPNETYSSNRSKRARARDIKIEHQHARSILKRLINEELNIGNEEI